MQLVPVNPTRIEEKSSGRADWSIGFTSFYDSPGMMPSANDSRFLAALLPGMTKR